MAPIPPWLRDAYRATDLKLGTHRASSGTRPQETGYCRGGRNNQQGSPRLRVEAPLPLDLPLLAESRRRQ